MNNSDLKKNLLNNYVFQNKFKDYFENDFTEILKIVEKNCGINTRNGDTNEIFRCTNFKLDGSFNGKNRSLSFPNIFSYTYAISGIDYSKINDFGKFNENKNMMELDFIKRKFKSNSFSESLEMKTNYLLSKYNRMYKIDIQSFYSSIYTHVFTKFENGKLSQIDSNIRLFNDSKTNQILLGNLFSTFSANEIMHFLSLNIEKDLREKLENKNFEVKYFSDQFYIFYNYSENIDKKIESIVKKNIDKPYFEYKINDNDSCIYNHEKLVDERNFNRKIEDIFNILKMVKIDFKDISYNKAMENNEDKIIHYMNSLMENYYKIEVKKRESFILVLFKKTFSSPVNMYRLDMLFENSKEKKKEFVIDVFMYFLKLHPALVNEYINMGIFYILSSTLFSDDFNKKRKELNYYFYIQMINSLDKIESIYYWHICYRLCKTPQEISSLKRIYKDHKCNYLLKSLIVENFQIKDSSKLEAKTLDLKGEDWLINYTKISQYTLIKFNERTLLNKIANECLKKNVKILRKIDDIKYDELKKEAFLKVKDKFDSVINKIEREAAIEL